MVTAAIGHKMMLSHTRPDTTCNKPGPFIPLQVRLKGSTSILHFTSSILQSTSSAPASQVRPFQTQNPQYGNPSVQRSTYIQPQSFLHSTYQSNYSQTLHSGPNTPCPAHTTTSHPPGRHGRGSSIARLPERRDRWWFCALGARCRSRKLEGG
jgi:hypothetical protein